MPPVARALLALVVFGLVVWGLVAVLIWWLT
jgi:hypothetical protein